MLKAQVQKHDLETPTPEQQPLSADASPMPILSAPVQTAETEIDVSVEVVADEVDEEQQQINEEYNRLKKLVKVPYLEPLESIPF